MPTAPQSVRNNARRGLSLRTRYGRGGTQVGIARARDIVNGRNLSKETLQRMRSFFARHASSKHTPPKDGNGKIAWLLWGGDAGRAWAERELNKMAAAKKRTKKNPSRKKPTAKQLAARKRFAAMARKGPIKKGTKLKKNPRRAASRSMKGVSQTTRKRAAKRKPASSLYTAKKAKTSKFLIVARVKDGENYAFEYYDGANKFLDTKRGAKRFATKGNAETVAKSILPKLPFKVLDLRIEKVDR